MTELKGGGGRGRENSLEGKDDSTTDPSNYFYGSVMTLQN